MEKQIGKNAIRVDSNDKARGKALYTADIKINGTLEISIVRSEKAHAILKGIKRPSINENCFFFTAKDIAENFLPSIFNEQPILADSHIRYMGEALAIVAAPTKEEADRIVSETVVEYEELPVVDSIEDAICQKAMLFDKGNVCTTFNSDKGDVDKAFSECAYIAEGTFETPVQAHGFLETESALCYMDADGKLSIVSSTQNPYTDLYTASKATGLPADKIKSKAATVGGAFGGKDGHTSQAYPAIVTHLTGKPSRYVFSREENLRYGMKRHKSIVRARLGFAKTGRILCADVDMSLDTGAYAIYGPSVLNLGLEHSTGAYNIENVRLSGRLMYTNHAPASAMRGFGAPQSAMAVENLINRAAEKLGISQIEIRKMNVTHTGDRGPMGGINEHSIGALEALEMFEKSAFYKEMTLKPEKDCGYSMALGMMSSGMGKHVPDTCHVRITRKGDKYTVSTSIPDIGQGSQTVLTQIAAEALGVDFSNVTVEMGNTEGNADSGSTAASRSTFVCGNAIIEAAKKIKGGASSAETAYSFPEATGEAIHTYFAFIVQGAKVKVDPLTGKTDVLWIHNTTETGKVINPQLLDGQVFGGVIMSVGMTLSEQIRYKEGKTLENSLANYCMPTALDAPKLTNEIVEKTEETGPYGAKGMAELPTVAVAPAIVSAVSSLYENLEINTLPIDRMTILKAQRRQK